MALREKFTGRLGIAHGPKVWLAQFLAVLMAFPSATQAQAVPAQAGATTSAQTLKVVPLAGDGELNDMTRKVYAPLVVQILDQESRPVEGAEVVFRFPASGPGAVFADGKTTVTVRANSDGQAAATNWVPNTPGRFEVQVTASRGTEIGYAVITMTNVTKVTDDIRKGPAKHWYSSKWVKIGLIAGAAAIVTVVILQTRGGDTTTLTAVPGFPTIGGAQ